MARFLVKSVQDIGIDFIGSILDDGSIVLYSKSKIIVRASDDTRRLEFVGEQFTWDKDGNITGGTIEQINLKNGTTLHGQGLNLDWSAEAFYNAIEDFQTGNDRPFKKIWLGTQWKAIGQAGDNDLIGGNQNDRLVGRGGDDLLGGYGGNDVLFGGAGNDSLAGFAGNDVLDGGKGRDELFGGFGRDRFVFDDGFGRDTILDFTHDVDKIDLRKIAGLDRYADINKSTNSDGDAVIKIGTSTITLDGVSWSEVDAGDFLV